MGIDNIAGAQSVKPSSPAAPTPPPGGNIENRQPPSEPAAPTVYANPDGVGEKVDTKA